MSDGSQNTFRGSCVCGAVHYGVSGPPVRVAQCCCTDCQKLTGTGHATIAFFREADFKSSGPVTAYEKTADSGNRTTRYFCPTCGSRLFGRNNGRPGIVSIFAGSLDGEGTDRLKPEAIVYAVRRPAWDLLDETIPHFPAMPPPPKT